MGRTRFMITSLRTYLTRIVVGDCRDGVLFYSYHEVCTFVAFFYQKLIYVVHVLTVLFFVCPLKFWLLIFDNSFFFHVIEGCEETSPSIL